MWFASVIAHVRYVTDEDAGPSVSPAELFQQALGDGVGIALAALVVAGVLAYVVVLPRLRKWGAFRVTLHASLADYTMFIPWILRLSTGIALMGSGVAGHLFVPHLEIAPRGLVSIVLLAAGFFILVGLAVRFAALVGLIVWGFAFGTRGFDILMASEVAAALVALTAISAGRPSLDDLLARVLPSAPRTIRPAGRLRVLFGPEPDVDVSHAFVTWVPVVLRVGLGLSLLYAGLAEKILDPGPALATVDTYDLAFWFITPVRWVLMVGLIETLLGLGIILGAAVRPLSALAFLVLTLTLFALPDDPVVAHVPLWGLASAVFILGCGPWSVDRERMRRIVEAE